MDSPILHTTPKETPSTLGCTFDPCTVHNPNDLATNRSKDRSKTAFTAQEAKACCTCRHWHRQDDQKGLCKNPQMCWGVEYESPDGTREFVEWWTTGCYATCPQYEELGGRNTAPEGTATVQGQVAL